MPTNLDKPTHEAWIGHPHGLRLRRHPNLAQAERDLAEYTFTNRAARVIDHSALAADQRPTIQIETLPALRQSTVGLTVELRIEIDYPRQGDGIRLAKLRLCADDIELHEHLKLRPGKRQIVTLPFPYFERPITLHVELEIRDEGRIQAAFVLQPERKLTWYVAFQTHIDLGWTDRVENVISSLRRMTSEDAVGICHQFADNPPGQRFVWTCECSEGLRYAWDGSDTRRRRQLLECIEQRLIRCCVMPFSFHTGIMSRELMSRAIQRSFALRREMGAEKILDLSVAQQQDVPGHNWVLPDLLAAANVRRAILGHNWLVRGVALPPLFRWRGPDGGEVLTLAMSCTDYGTPGGLPTSAEDLRGLSRNSAIAKPHAVGALFSALGYGENCGPVHIDREITAIQHWQRQFVYPKIVIGGPDDYFEHVERDADVNAFPVIDKEISDWWIDGPASMPVAMSQYRRAMVHLPHAPPGGELENQLTLFAEHTFGLHAQLVKVNAAKQDWRINQGFENYIGSWEDKERYATAAWRAAAQMKNSSNGPIVATSKRSWRIESDARGVTLLANPSGHVWIDSAGTPSWPRFGCVIQRLLPKDTGDWFHHDPPAAPYAGDRFAEVIETQIEASGALTVMQRLMTPAGAIRSIRFRLREAASCLVCDLELIEKQATAQSEVLALALPLLVHAPQYAGEVGGRVLRVDDDQLADSNRDEHAFGDGWIVSTPTSKAQLAVSSPDVFLWHFGGLRYCDFNKDNPPRSGEVYGHLFNNAWETNFRVWIGGNLRYRIFLRPVGPSESPLCVLREMNALWSGPLP